MLSTLGGAEKTASQGLSPGARRLAGKGQRPVHGLSYPGHRVHLCTSGRGREGGTQEPSSLQEGWGCSGPAGAERRAPGRRYLGSCTGNEGCVHQTGFPVVVNFGLFKSHKRSPLEETHLIALSVCSGGYLHLILSFKKSCRQTSRRPRSWSPLGSQPLCHSL